MPSTFVELYKKHTLLATWTPAWLPLLQLQLRWRVVVTSLGLVPCRFALPSRARTLTLPCPQSRRTIPGARRSDGLPDDARLVAATIHAPAAVAASASLRQPRRRREAVLPAGPVAGGGRLPELARHGGGEQRQGVAHGAPAVRRVRHGVHDPGPVRQGPRRRRGAGVRLRQRGRRRRRRRPRRLGPRRRRHLPLQPALLRGEAVRGVRSLGLQGLGQQESLSGDPSGSSAVHHAAGQGIQGLPPLREGRGDSGLVHGRQLGGGGLLWIREARHENTGVPRAELVAVQVGDEAAAGGRRLQDPRQRRRPVERPAGRLRRRPRVQDTQPHVLRPVIRSGRRRAS